MSTLVMPLAQAIRRFVEPGLHLHLASTPSRSNASIRELARAFHGTRPGWVLSATGFHSMAHLLPRLGLARQLIGCFFGDHYPAPRPSPLYARDLDLVHWPLWTMISSLRAAAQGDDWAVNRSLRGTTMGDELAARGLYREVAEVGLVAAIRPDVTFVHAVAADDEGHAILAGPLSEGAWGALAAKRGVIITVERIVSASMTRAHRASIAIPPHRVLAVCEEPFGAHPQPLLAPPGADLPAYRDDFEHYERWRALASDDQAFAGFVDRVIRAGDGAAAYRDHVGASHLAKLRGPAPVIKAAGPVATPADPLIVAGARQLATRARAIGAQVLIAGIGQAFFAARLAQLQLAAGGYRLRVMVETGLYDLDCGPDGHGYLLAYENMARARRVSAIDDILGALVGQRCLAALGAAQLDRAGNLNSTRLAGAALVGSGGACDIAASVAEAVVITRLGPGRLVDRLDYVTSPGRAVRSIVTDRGTLERDHGEWRLTSIADGGAPAAFARDCPWPIAQVTPIDAQLAAPITAAEVHLLTTLDPTGKYRHRAG